MINVTRRRICLKRMSVLLYIALFFLAMFPLSPVVSAKEARDYVMVSLGDSFSSGESIEKFYFQDKSVAEKVQEQDWLAHRSEKSWPGLLMLPSSKANDKIVMSASKGTNWHFVATSGATTEHLDGTFKKDYKKFVDPISGSHVPVVGGHSIVNVIQSSKPIDAQLDVFDQFESGEVDYVTMTLGGNDADFVGVIKSAAIGSTYLNLSGLSDKLNDIWSDFYNPNNGIREKLKEAYHKIASAENAGPQAKTIVAGYPKLLEQTGKGAFFSKEEATDINDSVSAFNREIATLVNSCKASGIKITFVSVEEEFDGHEAYSKVPYINKVILGTRSEDLKDGEPPSAYSVHPNEEGAKAYARCVQRKIDDLEEDGGESEWPVRTTSDERDIVLVLDASGSMSGTPMEETKKASEKFINTILKEDASIGIVAYDNSALKLSDFNINEYYLTEAAQGISPGGGTNIDAGLSTAHDMLKSSNAEKKIIVLMSDGEPNDGRVGEELIAYADSIKDEGILIYTLGFFESLGNKISAQTLMGKIASDGCHYEVADADSLVFFFGDIADQINGQKYIYVRIACPVDVTVSYDGETLSSSEDDLSVRTGFGSLTFEENESDSEDNSDNRVKVLRLKEGTDYDIRIEGTGRGRMNYTIGFMDESGEYSDLRRFTNIKISKRTVIDTVAENSNTTVLNVDEDGDGKYDLTYRAAENGRGELVDYTYVIYIVIGIIAFIILLVLFFTIRKRLKKNKNIEVH